MSTEFEITGLFYQANGHKFREYLDIKRMGTEKCRPDLMVVMMNPGSSYPLDGNEHNSTPSEAKPDNTQQQIIKVMDSTSLDYARILNLSDLRTPDSSELYSFVKSEASLLIAHSIFSKKRKSELHQLFVKDVPVIFAWGVNQVLIPLAKQAIDSLGIIEPLGLLKPQTKYSYYHPLPRSYEKQLEWVGHVSSQIKRTKHSAPVFEALTTKEIKDGKSNKNQIFIVYAATRCVHRNVYVDDR